MAREFAKAFYNSRLWRDEIRPSILKRDKYRCQMVHGSPSKPEAVLNPKQTSAFMELVESFRQLARFDNPLLSFVQSHKDALSSKINNTNNGGNTVTVAPGAVQIAVAQLNDKYDVDELANDIMNRMVVIANKSTNRGVNRR